MTGSEDSFAALYLGTRLVWSQRIRHAKMGLAMSSSSQPSPAQGMNDLLNCGMSDFGR